ncbi:SDR family NAD(P)-dependent oxidoreductase [Phytoactinopolyspora limicola]|uniref:SDR family NAD(P)-dependent oxidoreductase n=1 Tax=Phytoactinopolyspora limicola TaxID=2715536 RepID=UPI00140E3488|nr:SDR family oxidoreductase [Phytoactinopolyspora limicola]
MTPAAQRFSLSGRRVLITGARRGIGRGIAVALAEHGADEVIVLDRPGPDDPDVEATLAAVRAAGSAARYVAHDLGDTVGIRPLLARIRRDAGPLHVVVNNAGVATLEHAGDVTVEQWRQAMTVNAEAAFFVAQAAAESMIDDGVAGRIVNITSNNAVVAEAGLAAYNASKAAVESMTQTLAIELGPHGITVNTVAPGIIDTGLAEDFPLDRERFDEYYREHIPLQGRFGRVDDCVGAVVLLASDAGSYITGQRIVVDGGVLASQVPRLQFMPPPRRWAPGSAEKGDNGDDD